MTTMTSGCLQQPELLLNYHNACVYSSDLALLDRSTAWINDACINFQFTRLSVLQKERLKLGEECREDLPAEGPVGRAGGGNEKGNDQAQLEQDVFLDPSVISYLVHQCDDDEDELIDLNRGWNIPQPASKEQQQPRQRNKRFFVPVNDQYAASKLAFATPGGGCHWSLLLWEISTSFKLENGKSWCPVFESNFYHFDSSSGYNAVSAKAVSDKLNKVLRAGSFKQNNTQVNVFECRTPQQKNGFDCGVFMLGAAEALSEYVESPVTLKDYESIIHQYFDKMGGEEHFAVKLRNRIGGDIRNLSSLSNNVMKM